ncbi:MAG: GumC family protein [Beijerinckiaceae bacterium]
MSTEFSRAQQSSRDIDLADVWRAIVAGKKVILAVTFAFFAAALVYVVSASPRYSGEAKVLVENQEGYLTRQDRVDAAPDEAAVASQVQVVMSRDLARQAIRKLSLAGNPEFDPIAGAGGLIRQMVGLVTGSRSSTREDRIFEEYYKRINVFALPKSRVVSIEFQSRDPALAARGANVIAELYIEMQANAKRDQARAAAEALGAQVSLLRTKVAEAEGRVEAFRAQTGLMVGANNTTLPSQQLAEINAQLATARTAQADAQARARLLREALRNGRLNEVPDIANNELMRRVSEQRVTLRSQLALESRTLGPAHPRAKDLNAQIAAVEAEMRSLAERTARTLENDARIAGSRVEYLTAAVEKQMRAVSTSGDDEVRLREMEREARLTKEQLEQSTQRWQEAVARETSKATPGDARVISRAVEPEKPVSPKKMMILFAAIGGLALSIFGVVARAMIAGPGSAAPAAPPQVADRHAAADASDAGAALARPAPAPEIGKAGEGAPWPQGGAPEVEVAGRGGKSVAEIGEAIVSTNEEADGVFTLVVATDAGLASDAALELGRELADAGRAVLVDLTHSRGLRANTGLSSVLDGSATFGEALRRDPRSRLHLVDRGLDVIELGDNLENALVALSRTYDFVVVAVAAASDIELALGLASLANRCVVAQSLGGATQPTGSLAVALEESGASVVDIMEPHRVLSARRRVASAVA